MSHSASTPETTNKQTKQESVSSWKVYFNSTKKFVFDSFGLQDLTLVLTEPDFMNSGLQAENQLDR